MGFRWKVTLADGSVQYPVSTKRVNGLPKIETPGSVTKVPILISHTDDVDSSIIGSEITRAIYQYSSSMGYISHGKTLDACIKRLWAMPVNSTPTTYRSAYGPTFRISNVVLVFEFLPGYGDDVTDAELLRKLKLILGNIDSHLDSLWPMNLRLVSMFGGVYT